MSNVKKLKMYLLVTREWEETSYKFKQIWIQQAKSIFIGTKTMKKHDTVKK
jgi:hypothetical protein